MGNTYGKKQLRFIGFRFVLGYRKHGRIWVFLNINLPKLFGRQFQVGFNINEEAK